MKVIISILVMILTTFLIRVIPLTLFRKPVKSNFIKSFLYYVPYVTLSVMTVPAIIDATSNPLFGLSALLIGMFVAFKGGKLLTVAIICCLTVFVLQMLF